jgi:hypothetical protein
MTRMSAAARQSLKARFEERWPKIHHIVPRQPKGYVFGLVKLIAEMDHWARLGHRDPDLAPTDQMVKDYKVLASRTRQWIESYRSMEPASRLQLKQVDGRFLSQLARVRNEARRRASRRVKRSGGAYLKRAERSVKDDAAFLACELIICGTLTFSGRPVLGLNSNWIELTTILVQILLDREDVGDVYRSCKQLRRYRDWSLDPRHDRDEAN